MSLHNVRSVAAAKDILADFIHFASSQAVSYDFPGNTTQANLSDVPPHQAMDISEIPDPSKHYFIDDSLLNVKGERVSYYTKNK